MGLILWGIAATGGAAAGAGVLYAFMYALLRAGGVLAVGAAGWQAGALAAGGRTVASAWVMLQVFGPALRAEAALRARRGAEAGARERRVRRQPHGAQIPV